MPTYIVKLHEFYFEWSTIVDAPTSFGMPLQQFRDYYRRRYGEDGMEHLDERLARVDAHGSSARPACDWLPGLFKGNHAGPNETALTENEIYKAYCLRESIRDSWIVPTGVSNPHEQP